MRSLDAALRTSHPHTTTMASLGSAVAAAAVGVNPRVGQDVAPAMHAQLESAHGSQLVFYSAVLVTSLVVLERAAGAVTALLPALPGAHASTWTSVGLFSHFALAPGHPRAPRHRHRAHAPSRLAAALAHISAGSALAWAQLALLFAALAEGDAGNAYGILLGGVLADLLFLPGLALALPPAPTPPAPVAAGAAGGLLRGRSLTLRPPPEAAQWTPGTRRNVLVAAGVTLLSVLTVAVAPLLEQDRHDPHNDQEKVYFSLAGISLLVLAFTFALGGAYLASRQPAAVPGDDVPAGTATHTNPVSATTSGTESESETEGADSDSDSDEDPPGRVTRLPSVNAALPDDGSRVVAAHRDATEYSPLVGSHWSLSRRKRPSRALAFAGAGINLLAALGLLALAAYGADYAARRAAHHALRPTSALAHTLLPAAPALAQAIRFASAPPLSSASPASSLAWGSKTVSTLLLLGLGVTLLALPPSKSGSFPPWPAGTSAADVVAALAAVLLALSMLPLRASRWLAVPLLGLYGAYVLVALAPPKT